MSHLHHYKVTTRWEDPGGEGNKNVRKYDRTHTASISGKPVLQLTTDNAAVGNKAMLNPEDLLLTSISSCHMLSYLYACSLEGVVVLQYTDQAQGSMIDLGPDGGHFQEVTLHPEVVVADASMVEKAIELHHEAHRICYIANSVNFEVHCEPRCRAIQQEA